MKRIKRVFAFLLSVCLSVSVLCVSASASDNHSNMQAIVYHVDGSYTVTTITADSLHTSARASVQEKSGEKEIRQYDRSNQLVWTFRVHGTFSYDGYSAEATSADYSYDIYDSAWTFGGGSASYFGDTSTADGSFIYRFVPNSVSVSLTCSPKGVLS